MSHAPAASRLANPFTGDIPTKIEAILSLNEKEEEGHFTSISFNDRGTYLAAGTSEGELVIWDLVTLSPALRVKHLHRFEINSLSWVRKGKGRLVCTTCPDGWLKVFDLERKSIHSQLNFQQEFVGASIHPGNLDECLCAFAAEQGVRWPELYRFNPLDRKSIKKPDPVIRYVAKGYEDAPRCYGIAATFSKHGSLVFVGGLAGAIMVFATNTGEHLSTYLPEGIRGGPKGWVLALSLSRNGRVLLSDSGGRLLSIYDVASDAMLGRYDELSSDCTIDMIQDAMRWRADKVLTFRRTLWNPVQATKWNDMGCSGNGEFVFGVNAAKDVHDIFIWAVTGHLVTQLQDNTHASGGIARGIWHPWRPQIATLTGPDGQGKICLWGNNQAVDDKSWLAFAPGFVEIEENVVYKENEDGKPANETTDIVMEKVDVIANDSFPQMFSEDEDSEEDEPSVRTAPRQVTRGIGYFIQATTENLVIDASQL
jgi:COMPASS component SWD1